MTDQINANPEGATHNNEQQGPQIAVQRVFTKDISFEAPNSPEIFQDKDFKPEIKLDMNSRSRKLNDNVYEVVLSITLTATSADKTAFLVEVKQAGIFVAKGLEDDQLRHLLSVFCPETLYPYAREAISSLVNRGGFPPVYLAPVSFEALFRAQLAQQAQQQNDATPATE